MNPIRKICLAQARLLWQDQPSLGMLETVNEVRVALRAQREVANKDIPGVESLRQWLTLAIEAGELRGPSDIPRNGRSNKGRTKP